MGIEYVDVSSAIGNGDVDIAQVFSLAEKGDPSGSPYTGYVHYSRTPCSNNSTNSSLENPRILV